MAIMLVLNVCGPQTVRCLRIVERPQSRPFDPHLRRNCSWRSASPPNAGASSTYVIGESTRPSAQLAKRAAEARLKAASAKWMSRSTKYRRPTPLRCSKCSRNAHRFAHRRGGCCRAHPAPSRALERRGARASHHRPAGRNDPRSVARRPLPRYDTEPVMAFSATFNVRQGPSAPLAPLVQRPPALRRQLLRVADAPRNPKRPVFDFRAHSCHSAPMETHAFGFRLRANAPEGQKRFPISGPGGREPEGDCEGS